MNTSPSLPNLLQQIAQIQSLERGKLSVIKESAAGPFYKLQAREKGKNVTRYVPREQVRILSLGCGDNPYSVTGRKISKGGMLHWRDIISAAMRLQSQNALGQAGLLIGPERIMMGSIVRAIDGPLAPLPCASETAYRRCQECVGELGCETRLVMREVRDAVTAILDRTSLAQVCERTESRRAESAATYEI